MVVAIFRSRLRPEAGEEYGKLAREMLQRAEAMPGFRSFRHYAAEDGERVSIVEFDSMETLEAWRDDPHHRRAQKLGRERFYAEYEIVVGEVARRSAFTAEDASRPAPPSD